MAELVTDACPQLLSYHAHHQSDPPLRPRPRPRPSDLPSSGRACRLWYLSSHSRHSRRGMLLYCWLCHRQFLRRDRRCIDHSGSEAGFGVLQRRLRYLFRSLRYCVLDADALMVDEWDGLGRWTEGNVVEVGTIDWIERSAMR
jgi:hypothetical protein